MAVMDGKSIGHRVIYLNNYVKNSKVSGQHYNQCDKATNKDQAREREEREREK